MIEPQIPSDFDSFWRETLELALASPMDWKLGSSPEVLRVSSHNIRTIEFRGVKGNRLYGWTATPHVSDGPRRAFLWVPPYGRESLLPNQYGIREDFVSMSFNFFGLSAFHQEKYTPSRGYFSEGVEDEHTWVFREMFQNAVIAVRALAQQEEVDQARIGVAGMSQGGGLSVWLGAWLPLVKAVCADMPFLGGMCQVLGDRVYRYPLKELTDHAGIAGLDQIKRTISYFDTLNVATRCNKPTHVTLGEKDPAVKPSSVEAIFAALPGRKVLRRYEVGHDWFLPMVENNRQWLVENL